MKNRKKILHLIQSLDNGGCENMLLRTLPLLSDFEHNIITLNHQGELADKFKEKNISIINISQKNILDIFSYRRLLKNIKKNNPDLIITYLFHADAIGRIFLQIFTKIQIIPFLRTTYNHERYWLARLFEKFTKYFVKNYLANSQSVKNFYVDNIGVKKEKITVISNGIDTDFYSKIERDESLRKNLGIREEEIAMICVANLHITKGHKYLLEAFENIYQKNKNIKLLLVGDGDERKKLEKQVNKYFSKNNILFLGKRNDVPRLLKISDIFILPTLFEGMSNAIMEAMAAGKPIITTDIPENKDLIENKETGILFPARDTKSLQKDIKLLMSDFNFREKLGQNAQQKAGKDFDIQKVANQFASFYQEI